MTGTSIGVVVIVLALGVPIAFVAWTVIHFGNFRRKRPFRSPSAVAIEITGAVTAQALGLALFALAATYQSTGEVEFVSGVVGYGTLLFSPWAGVGAWVFGSAFVGPIEHSKRALLVACMLACGSVLIFFAAAAALRFDDRNAWMLVYALSPIGGAVCGYRLGAGSVSEPPGGSESKT
jgi:hypothetical protein